MTTPARAFVYSLVLMHNFETIGELINELARGLEDSHLRKLTREIKHMAAELDARITALTTEVTRNTTVVGSAKVLIEGFSARLDEAVAAASAAGATTAQLQQLTELSVAVKKDDDALAAAVAANTGVTGGTSPVNPATGQPFLSTDVNSVTGQRFGNSPNQPFNQGDSATRATARAAALRSQPSAATFTWVSADGQSHTDPV